MKNHFNVISLDEWFGKTERTIKGVFGRSVNMEQPENVRYKPASEESNQTAQHESMLGSLFFDIYIGGGLTQLFADTVDAPQWSREIDWGQGVEIYEEFTESQRNTANESYPHVAQTMHGQGSFASTMTP